MESKSRSMRMIEICRFKNNKESPEVKTPLSEVIPNKIKPIGQLKNSDLQNIKRSTEVNAPLSDITPYGISNIIIIEPDNELMQAIDYKNSDLNISSCSVANKLLLENDNLDYNITELENQERLDNVPNLSVFGVRCSY